ncbi:MAG TPA: pyruvate kinase, partial [Sphingomicrobium sp.]|nr:pyruvate kinase [Sphingomicrobium sp.]
MTPRARKVRILATLGPASSSPEMIRKLYEAGADAFRLNMSHGDQEAKIALIQAIRALEQEYHRPTTILVDLQGPKLRVGDFEGGEAMLDHGQRFVLDRNPAAGDASRVELPHPELFEAVDVGDQLLINDGKIRLRVEEVAADHIETRVEVGGRISNSKGVNVPDVVVPIP